MAKQTAKKNEKTEKSLAELKKEYQKAVLDMYLGKEKNLKKARGIRKEIARYLERRTKI